MAAWRSSSATWRASERWNDHGSSGCSYEQRLSSSSAHSSAITLSFSEPEMSSSVSRDCMRTWERRPVTGRRRPAGRAGNGTRSSGSPEDLVERDARRGVVDPGPLEVGPHRTGDLVADRREGIDGPPDGDERARVVERVEPGREVAVAAHQEGADVAPYGADDRGRALGAVELPEGRDPRRARGQTRLRRARAGPARGCGARPPGRAHLRGRRRPPARRRARGS